MITYLISKAEGLSGGALTLAAILIVAIVIAIPFGVIWSFSTLFDISIPYDLKHWGAAMLLVVIFTPAPKQGKNQQ